MAGFLLNLGCGTGLELDEIFRYHPDIQVTGIDLSEEMLHMLRKKHPDKKMKLVAGDYFKEPFGTACFDVAVSFETLHHFTEKKWKIPDNQFVHFDTPLTLEHEMELLRKAGFSQVEVLGTIDDTSMIRAIK